MKTRPFNFEEAKAGKPVVTRDFLPVRILCFDRKGFKHIEQPIVAAIEDEEGNEWIETYFRDGHYLSDEENVRDLMMVCETKMGWVNIYKDDDGYAETSGVIYQSREDAIERRTEECIDTVKLEWYE